MYSVIRSEVILPAGILLFISFDCIFSSSPTDFGLFSAVSFDFIESYSKKLMIFYKLQVIFQTS